MTRVLLVVGSLAIFVILGGLAGVVKGEQDDVWSEFNGKVEECVARLVGEPPDPSTTFAGHGREEISLFDSCSREVASSDSRFDKLDLTLPLDELARLRSENFAAWRCVEGSGYRRVTPIPLSGDGGYPLRLTSGHFDVGESEAELLNFYRAAAECSGRTVDSLRGPDGELMTDLADGDECVEHLHDGWAHSHGCHTVDTYPKN